MLTVLQIEELAFVPDSTLIVRDDFKAYSKIRIENHMYNECVPP